MNSVNQPWAISDKYRQRYGNTWADMDLEFKQIREDSFKTDPDTVVIGTLVVANQRVDVSLKDLHAIQQQLKTMLAELNNPTSDQRFEVRIRSRYIALTVSEINRLYETIDDSILTIFRKYQLGLYL